jgi:hypothetical protein
MNMRRRKTYSQLSKKIETCEFSIQTSLSEDDSKIVNDLFSPLSDIWTLFLKGDYENAFSPIYHLAGENDARAQYLLGGIYEYGLGRIHSSHKKAVIYYSLAAVNTDNPLLKKKAEAKLDKLISLGASPINYKPDDSEPYFQTLIAKKNNIIVHPENKCVSYSRENLYLFLNHLKRFYTYQHIADKTKRFDKITICKLAIYKDYNEKEDYESFWYKLKEVYPSDFMKVSFQKYY